MKRNIINSVSRRNLFKFGATAVGTGLITSKLGLDLFDAPAADANVKNQIATLKASPVLTELIDSNKLKIVGGFYNLDTGVMTQIA